MKACRRTKGAAAKPSVKSSALMTTNGYIIHRSFLELTEEQRIDRTPREFHAVSFRECVPGPVCDGTREAAEYWKRNIATSPLFRPAQENLYTLMLTTRRTVLGHYLVGLGTLDTVLAHPRETFRVAIMMNAAAIIVMHNHPSGEPDPSESDTRVTKDLIRAGQLMKIEVLDHVIMGKAFASLRTLGHFA